MEAVFIAVSASRVDFSLPHLDRSMTAGLKVDPQSGQERQTCCESAYTSVSELTNAAKNSDNVNFNEKLL